MSTDDLASFLNELSELSRKYRLGITGKPVLFVMEPDDAGLSYQCDDESNLALG